MKIRVFSIEEFSVYDGPGIRTTIFLKGCPLRCNWCHSPEGQSFINQCLRSPNGCLHCNRCIEVCPTQRKHCVGCGKCLSVCPRNLLRLSSIDYEIKELADTIEKNINILNMNNGGVTFSGGEPLSQAEPLLKLIEALKGKTHLALQTSGYSSIEDFKKIVNQMDLVLFDMKIINPQQAEIYEGIDNRLILNNFEYLKKSNIPFIIRIPLIPGVIDTEENINQIIELIKDSPSMQCVELLPYNKYAGSKYKMVDRVYSPLFDENIPSNPHLDLFKKNGIKARVL